MAVFLVNAFLSIIGAAMIIYVGLGLLGIRVERSRLIVTSILSGLLTGLTSQAYIYFKIPLGSHTLVATLITIALIKTIMKFPWGIASAGLLTGTILSGFGPFVLIAFLRVSGLEMKTVYGSPILFGLAAFLDHSVIILFTFLVARKGIKLLNLRDIKGAETHNTLMLLNLLLTLTFILVFIGVYTAMRREPLYAAIPSGVPGWFFWAMVTAMPVVALMYVRKMQRAFQMERELKEAEGLAAVGRLVSNIVHEVRNPVMCLRGNLQVLQRLIKLGSIQTELKKSIDISIKELDHLQNLLNELLQLGKPEVDIREPVEMGSILSEVVSGLEQTAVTEGVEVEINAPADLPKLYANKQRLKQAITNLVINAVQSKPADGRIRLIASYDRPNDRLHLDVSDTGCGIPETDLERIFEPFYTSRSDGTGLGLAIVKKIVTDHRGHIRVASSPQGTVFSMEFPVEENRRALSKKPPEFVKNGGRAMKYFSVSQGGGTEARQRQAPG